MVVLLHQVKGLTQNACMQQTHLTTLKVYKSLLYHLYTMMDNFAVCFFHKYIIIYTS